MRWLFLLLFLANLGLAYLIYQETTKAPAISLLEDMEDIRLFSERQPEAAPLVDRVQEKPSGDLAPGEPLPGEPPLVTAESLQPTAVGEKEMTLGAGESNAEVIAGQSDEAGTGEKMNPLVSEQPSAEEKPPVVQEFSESVMQEQGLADTAQPASESQVALAAPGGKEEQSSTVQVTAVSTEEPGPTDEIQVEQGHSVEPKRSSRSQPAAEVREVEVQEPEAYCAALGPTKQISDARKLAQKLEARGIDSTLRRELEQRPLGFWVVLPPYKTQKAAIDAVLELRKKGIKDIRRFIEGEQRNGISLGVFSLRENAERRRQEIARKGLQARVEPRFVETAVYWVDYRSEGVKPEEVIADMRLDAPDLEQRIQTCPRIVRP